MNKVFMALLTIVAVSLAGCKEKPGKGEAGYDILNSKCGRCHPTGVKKNHTTREEWDKTVTRMMGKGAALNDAEKTTLLDFLVKYYQPETPK